MKARWLTRTLGHLLAVVFRLWRLTCRRRILHDPRASLRRQGTPYVFAMLHAHQIAALMAHDERHLAVMVSRSSDGDLLVPSLASRGVTAMRGSSRRAGIDKGGRQALEQLADWVRAGRPALLAVDGPKGPRGAVHTGILRLADATGAAIVPVLARASRSWCLRNTWDRMCLPKPGARLELIFLPPYRAAATQPLPARQAELAQILAEGERVWLGQRGEAPAQREGAVGCQSRPS